MELPDADSSQQRINLDEPRYDQGTFTGRAKHFLITTNPLNLFASSQQLDEAKQLVHAYRKGQEPPDVTDDEIWRAKHLYDSAFHPDTGEKMMLIGRMSAQVPMNMSITGCMLTFYKTSGQTIFWQWINQTFNAVVNYTNRSGDHPIPVSQLGLSYVLATGGAVGTALGINKLVHRFPPIVARFVPFVAVAAANCINIPCMRSRELSVGIPVFDEYGKRIGESVTAARKAISQVVVSRVSMAAPGMLLTAVIMDRLEKRSFIRKYPIMNPICQVGLVGIFLVFATPLCCALFPQKSSISVPKLEPELQEIAQKFRHPPTTVYFNKGL
ncbi:sideroflexin-1-like [Tubulanus polymorphus]|uniref:sideroflexin-1-like n=1 Tax=Tubulanus polymorphus TaxID=672921 RepID=UPI003DA1F09E